MSARNKHESAQLSAVVRFAFIARQLRTPSKYLTIILRNRAEYHL